MFSLKRPSFQHHGVKIFTTCAGSGETLHRLGHNQGDEVAEGIGPSVVDLSAHYGNCHIDFCPTEGDQSEELWILEKEKL